jgi:hypothetical protein
MEESNELVRMRFQKIAPFLDERMRRLMAATEAEAIGRGGITRVSRETGLCREAIRLGQAELQGDRAGMGPGRMRQVGGGRKRTEAKDPTLRSDLERLIDPVTRGDPESPLRWTCKSTRQLAEALKALGHQASHRMVAALLHDLGYSLQGNRKTLEGASHPDRNAQFEYLHSQVVTFQGTGDPVISVDTKKKELVGRFKNGGREWQPEGQPEPVKTHDFPDAEGGKVAPYGVYDPTRNEGWVNVGTDHDTAAFAVESIRRWWAMMGREAYPVARRLLITADSGGSNGARVRLWKVALQALANETGLAITVGHLPPGTSKWNKIEHRVFAAISQNWRGRPLISHEVIVNLIAGTTSRQGLKVRSALDMNQYPKGIKVSDEEMAALNIRWAEFHREWNYSILPQPT